MTSCCPLVCIVVQCVCMSQIGFRCCCLGCMGVSVDVDVDVGVVDVVVVFCCGWWCRLVYGVRCTSYCVMLMV